METQRDSAQLISLQTELLETEPSFAFLPEEIDRAITRTSPGVFGLGYLDQDGRFVVKRLGRSDTDIAEELQVQYASYRLIRVWLDDSDPLYDHFTFAYASSPDEAFEKECFEYHTHLEELDNQKHPTRDNGAGRRSYCPIWQCPWNY